MIDNLSQNTRLIIAALMSSLIIFSWQYFFVEPIVEGYEDTQVGASSLTPKAIHFEEQIRDRSELVSEGFKNHTRVKITNPKIEGSINLVGARFDDLVLKNYKTSIHADSTGVVLLSPSKTKNVYFAEFGWSAHDESLLPNNSTLWHADKSELKAGETVTLSWANTKGMKFLIKYSLDENYLLSVEQEVKNTSGHDIKIGAVTILNRSKPQEAEASSEIFHEGVVGVFNGKLKEISYADVEDAKVEQIPGTTSWLGFGDKYWLTSIFSKNTDLITTLSHAVLHKQGRYQLSLAEKYINLAPGQSHVSKTHMFAGAKELDLLETYQTKFNLTLFDRAVDFGWLYFITKPIFMLLHYFHALVGNFGIAILLLTVLIKILLFPLAHKGFKGMNRLKDLQPKMAELKKKHENDAPAFQKALLEMYRKEKVNPMSGCLPIVLQIPVFFALYKVLYVSIEMRHAPFFLWIEDLSAPDPTSIFNLFGLIPLDLPQFLMIGVFPILMALSMYFQQRLNPEPADPIQAKMMKFMPLIFLFMFSSFPSGLVIYWTWSNLLSILQQLLIKKLEKKEKEKLPVKKK